MSKWKFSPPDEDNGSGYGDIYINYKRGYTDKEFVEIHEADCAAYEARIARLEGKLAAEVASNAAFRAREVSDYEGSLLQEIADKNNRIAEILDMLKPATERPKHEDFVPFDHDQWNTAVCKWDRIQAKYTRARNLARSI